MSLIVEHMLSRLPSLLLVALWHALLYVVLLILLYGKQLRTICRTELHFGCVRRGYSSLFGHISVSELKQRQKKKRSR